MPKNPKSKPPKKTPSSGPPAQFRDLTAERQLKSGLSKAEKLLEDENYDEALDLLLPLARRHPQNAELFDLLGVAYISVNALEPARDAFEHALTVAPKKGELSMAHFNLAHLYVLTGFPLLAFQQCQMVDWKALSREIDDKAEAEEFRQLCEAAVDEMAVQNQQTRESLLRYALPLEQGQLALQRNDPATARARFTEAAKEAPDSSLPLNSLALAYIVEGNYAQAIKIAQGVLERFGSDNLDALMNLTRATELAGQSEESRAYLARIKALPRPSQPEDLIEVASLFGNFDDDESVYDLLQPLLKADNAELEELDEETRQELAVLGAVAASHLGRPGEARQIVAQVEAPSDNILLERLRFALANDELGPRAEGRFFYTLPTSLYPTAFNLLSNLLDKAAGTKSYEQYRTLLNPLFRQFPREGLEMVAFNVWISDEAGLIGGFLTQILASKVEGGPEMVKRLAFTRAGSEPHRLVAATVLLQEGLIGPEEEVTVWLDGQPRTARLQKLLEDYTAQTGQDAEA